MKKELKEKLLWFLVGASIGSGAAMLQSGLSMPAGVAIVMVSGLLWMIAANGGEK